MAAPSPERWDEIERLLDRALDRSPEHRAPLIEEIRSRDAPLAADLERFLRASEEADGFLEEPASTYAQPLLAWVAEQEPLAAGTTFGPYEVIRRLGRGAAGTVYLARDPKHHRAVALKVLHPELAAAVGSERFLREIEIAAALHHPHILPLFDSGAIDGLLYYVMPHVEGESLRATLVKAQRMPVDTAIRIAREIAGALDYSHRHGVVHRDIKPENILLQDGQAIVADFGIARAIDAAGADPSGDPIAGTGTPAYMSPEQASPGSAIDGRTDIYSLGCVLYEMLAGRPPFTGDSAQEILARHAREPVPSLPAGLKAVHPAIEGAVLRALAKQSGERFATAAEFANALATTDREPAGPGKAPSEGNNGWGPMRAWHWILGAAVMSAAVVGLVAIGSRRPAEIGLGHRTPLTLDAGLEIDAAISPDGRYIAYAAGSMAELRIIVRSVDARTSVLLAPAIARPQRFPTWSPDGRRILFRSPRGIEVTPAFGGETKLLIRDPNISQSEQGQLRGSSAALMPGAWSPDGRQFTYVRSDSLYIAGIDGGSTRLMAQGGEPHMPVWSPDGRWIAYVEGNRQSLEPGFYFGNVGKSTIYLVGAAGGEPIPITDNRSSSTSPAWLRSGRTLLFVSDREGGRDIYSAHLSRSGSPRTITRLTTGLNPLAISLSADGRRLIYTLFSESSNIWTLPIPSDLPVSVSEARPVTAGNQVIEGFDVSPDARWLAFDSDRSGNPDIYRIPVAGGEPEQLTTDPGSDFGPLWSPDGREIAFHSFRTGLRHVFVMSADGTHRVQVTAGNDDERSPVWVQGGRGILFRNFNGVDKDLRVVLRDRRGRWGEPRTILRGEILQVAVSPDGSRLAFSSNRGLNVSSSTGDSSRVLIPVNDPASRLRPSYVCWSSNGREIYYLALDALDRASIWSVALTGGAPRLLVRFDDPTKEWHRFGFRARGGRFYFTLGDRQSDIWALELKQGG